MPQFLLYYSRKLAPIRTLTARPFGLSQEHNYTTRLTNADFGFRPFASRHSISLALFFANELPLSLPREIIIYIPINYVQISKKEYMSM